MVARAPTEAAAQATAWAWFPEEKATKPASRRAAGVASVYTPKDFDVTRIMGEIVDLVGERAEAGAPA